MAIAPATLVRIPQKKMIRESQDEFELGQFKANLWRAYPEKGIGAERVLERDYWGHVAHKISRYDIIEVIHHDIGLYQRLLVTASARNWVEVAELELVEFKKGSPATIGSDFDFTDGGPAKGWQVVRRSTGQILSEKHKSQEAAQAWALDLLKTEARTPLR